MTSQENRLSILLSHLLPNNQPVSRFDAIIAASNTSGATAGHHHQQVKSPSAGKSFHHAGDNANHLESSSIISMDSEDRSSIGRKPATQNAKANHIASSAAGGKKKHLSSKVSKSLVQEDSFRGRNESPMSQQSPPTFNVKRMADWVRGTTASPEFIEKYLKLLNSPIMQKDFVNLTKEQSRKLLTEQLRFLLKSGLFRITDQKYNPTRLLTSWSMFGWQNFAIQVKLVVHLYLYGGAIFNLGTERHMKMIPGIESLAAPGAFCMTELEHGSNVRQLQTRAVYDRETEEFIINTPNEGALKWWIGNLQKDAINAAVFARLIIDDKDYGIHAFVVPIRNPNMEPLKGVYIGDCGDKIGLNSIDNGFVGFRNVRIPRVNLLNKYGDVLKDGSYVNEFGSRRFTAMLGELISGRMAIIISTLTYRRIATTVALRYALQRKQFGSRDEQPVFSYATHQLKLMPILASCYIYEFSKRFVMHMYEVVHGKEHQSSEDDLASLHAYVSGFKAITTWDTQQYLQILRESCGGQGYSSYNRFGEMKNDNDIKATFEGDNTVLVQQLSSYLLKKYGAVASEKLSQIESRLSDMTEHNFADEEFQKLILEHRMLSSVRTINSYMSKMRKKLGYFTAWQNCGPQTIKLARAAVEYRALCKYSKHCDKEPAQNFQILKLMQQIYVVDRVIQDALSFVGIVNTSALKTAESKLMELCKELAPHAAELVNAFELPDSVVRAPIGKKNKHYVRETLHEALVRNQSNHSFRLREYPFHKYTEKDEETFREFFTPL